MVSCVTQKVCRLITINFVPASLCCDHVITKKLTSQMSFNNNLHVQIATGNLQNITQLRNIFCCKVRIAYKRVMDGLCDYYELTKSLSLMKCQ